MKKYRKSNPKWAKQNKKIKVEINILNIFNSTSKHRYEKKAEILFKNKIRLRKN